MENTIYEDRGHVKRYCNTDIIAELTKIHGEEYTEYRTKWDLTEKGAIIPEKPLDFWFETNSHCNLKCKMCYHSITSEKVVKHNVSLETIKEIIKQCKELGIPSVEMGSGAECTLHPEIKEILKIFKTSGGMDHILITNGTLLTEELINLILDLKIERFMISVDAATAETYKKIRGGDFERLENNINKFLELRNKRNLKTPILRLSFVKQEDNIHEVNAFLEKWKDKADIVDFQDYIDHGNVDNIQDIEVENFICPHPFRSIGMLNNGDLVPCCTFFDKYFILGNIKNMTIEEAWNCDKIKALRQSFLDGKIHKVCKNCYGSLTYRKEMAVPEQTLTK